MAAGRSETPPDNEINKEDYELALEDWERRTLQLIVAKILPFARSGPVHRAYGYLENSRVRI